MYRENLSERAVNEDACGLGFILFFLTNFYNKKRG